MQKKTLTRRQFLAASAGTVAAVTSGTIPSYGSASKKTSKLAILGGDPVRTKGWLGWPTWGPTEEKAVLAAYQTRSWSRGRYVSKFESKYAEMMGTRRALGTTNGTHALIVSQKMLGIGWGDEVITGPYSFIATFDSIMLNGALPIFVDTDRQTFQIDASKIEAKITKNTKAILPIHILGLPAEMDKIMAIAKKHNLFVVEDACQAHMAEYKGKECGSIGEAGCFSFQTSKNLSCGEGGANISDNEKLMDLCRSFHNFGRAMGEEAQSLGGNVRLGTKCRMAEYQAVLLLAKMELLEEQTKTRDENAKYLTSKIKDIPCVNAIKLYDGVEHCAYHLYPFRYNRDQFNNLSRGKFMAALKAEGIPCNGGYGQVNKGAWFENTLNSPAFQKFYSKEQLDWCRQANDTPENAKMCSEAVWFGQSMLLGTKKDMDDIADAIAKVYENRDKLV